MRTTTTLTTRATWLGVALLAVVLSGCFAKVDDKPDTSEQDSSVSTDDVRQDSTDTSPDTGAPCEQECGASQPDCCDGVCLDTQFADAHCGACGNVCGQGLACVEGSCVCNRFELVSVDPPPNSIVSNDFVTFTFTCDVDPDSLSEGVTVYGDHEGKSDGSFAIIDDNSPNVVEFFINQSAGEVSELTFIQGRLLSTNGVLLNQSYQARFRRASEPAASPLSFTPGTIPDSDTMRSQDVQAYPRDFTVFFANVGEDAFFVYNDDDGSLSRANFPTFGEQDTVACAFADLDGDSFRELYLGASYLPDDTSNRSVWFASDSVALDLSSPNELTQHVSDFAWGDIDRNGDLDLVMASDSPNLPTAIASYDSTGALNTSRSLGAFEPRHTAVALGDVNGDQLLDIALSARDDKAYVGLGDGSTLETLSAVGSRGGFAIALGDLDGDRLDDLVHGTDGGGVEVWLSESGVFTTLTTTLDAGASIRAVAVGDLDGDGDLDIVSASSVADAYHLNSGDGTSFESSALGTQSHGVLLFDITGDGLLDIIFADADEGDSNTVWLQNAP